MLKNLFAIIFFYLIFVQNCFAWDNFYSYNPFKRQTNPAQKGTMTGYSVPVNNDIFKKLDLDPNASNMKSPTRSTELFSSPTGDYGYNQSNSRKSKGGGSVGSSTGVRIIYD